VFGLMSDASADQLRGYVDQLVAGGWLRQTQGDYPVLQLTATGLELMKDPTTAPDLQLARQRKPQKGRPDRASRAAAASWEGVDRDLFESLRVLRLSIARARAVPPYVVFHDTTLRELARLRPGSVEQLRHVYGVGVRKAEDYGVAILQIIAEHGRAAPAP
jgi:ATP-dependent DNA helicase RecQ